MNKFIQLFIVIINCLLIFSCEIDMISPQKIEVQDKLLEGINGVRMTGCICGQDTMPTVKALTINIKLTNAAEGHALDMATRNFFEHKNPDGLTAISRVKNQGYLGNEVGEIIAKNYNTTDDVIAGWLKSESHCKAIMAENYNEMGAGRVANYWVVNFGKK